MTRFKLADTRTHVIIPKPSISLLPPAEAQKFRRSRYIVRKRRPKSAQFGNQRYKYNSLSLEPSLRQNKLRSSSQTYKYRGPRSRGSGRDFYKNKQESNKFKSSAMMNLNLDSSDGWKAKTNVSHGTNPLAVNNLLKEARALNIRDAHNLRISVFDHPNNVIDGLTPFPDIQDVANLNFGQESVTLEPFIKVQEVYNPNFKNGKDKINKFKVTNNGQNRPPRFQNQNKHKSISKQQEFMNNMDIFYDIYKRVRPFSSNVKFATDHKTLNDKIKFRQREKKLEENRNEFYERQRNNNRFEKLNINHKKIVTTTLKPETNKGNQLTRPELLKPRKKLSNKFHMDDMAYKQSSRPKFGVSL